MNKNDLAQRLNAIIDSAIDGIVTIDSKGIIESANNAAAELFQYSIDELEGNSINMLMPKRYASHHDGYIKKYEETRKAKIIGIGRKVEGQRKDGSTFPFRLAVSEVILHNKVVYTGIIHDMSEVDAAHAEISKINKELEQKVESRTAELEDAVNKLLSTNKNLTSEIALRQQITKELEESETELKKTLAKEKELNELKSRFVSMASHEFRTPLTSILSSAAIISKYTLEEQQSKRIKHVDRIKSAVSNLTGILNDFLSLSKLEEGRVLVESSPFDLIELSHETIEDLQQILKSDQQIKICAEVNNLALITDKRILKNILFNLLSNAIKYSDDDIQLVISIDHDECEIAVKDQGIGIPEEDQKHLFTRFFRARNSVNIQGTGLGLNIVKRYVGLLQGSLDFTSKYGEGSTFKIRIPLSLN